MCEGARVPGREGVEKCEEKNFTAEARRRGENGKNGIGKCVRGSASSRKRGSGEIRGEGFTAEARRRGEDGKNGIGKCARGSASSRKRGSGEIRGEGFTAEARRRGENGKNGIGKCVRGSASSRKRGSGEIRRDVAGGRGLRTYRRTCPAASGSSGIFDDRGGLGGPRIVADSILRSLRSRGTAIRAIRSPRDVVDSNPRSPRRPHPHGCGRKGWKARREVQSTVMQRFLARKKTVLRARGGARPCLQKSS